MKPNIQVLEKSFRVVLNVLGLDVDDPSLKDTPKRMAKMYATELFSGLYEKRPKVTVFPNDGSYNQMIVLKNTRVVSTCEHHFLPFTGRAWVAYLPRRTGNIVGVSKLARVVNWWARRPQVQERLTQQIADYLNKVLDPKGVIVVIEAVHNCMVCRGVMEEQTSMVTSAFHGEFEEPEVRAEFFSLMNRGGA